MLDMVTCDTCGKNLPKNKFNVESFSPLTCFRCRVQGVAIGFGGYRNHFNGSQLHGGTLASDNRHTIESARAQGHDPVPASKGVSHGLSGTQMTKLRSALDKKFG
jgi:hypothetical protein